MPIDDLIWSQCVAYGNKVVPFNCRIGKLNPTSTLEEPKSSSSVDVGLSLPDFLFLK